MKSKTIFSVALVVLSVSLVWKFILPMQSVVINPLTEDLQTLQNGYDAAVNQTSIENLRRKRNNLSLTETKLLETYVPENLQSGKFSYKMFEIASQNRVAVKNLQYAVVESGGEKGDSGKRLVVEMQVDGSYANFYRWISTLERSDILIDIQSISASKSVTGPLSGDTVSFSIKMSTYGLNIQ